MTYDRVHWVIVRKHGNRPELSSSLLVYKHDDDELSSTTEVLEKLSPGISHLEASRYLDKWLAIDEVSK